MLTNIKQERFARYIAQGITRSKAYGLAGYTPSDSNAWHLYNGNSTSSYKIRQRVKQLLDAKDLTKQDILNQVLTTRELASESGQHSAALKASEMLGKELFHMFTDRRENVNINIASMSQTQLQEYLITKYGDTRAKELMTWLDSQYKPNTVLNTISPDSMNPVNTVVAAATPALRLVKSSTD